MADEAFACYTPATMRDDPRWVDVTSLYTGSRATDRSAECPLRHLAADRRLRGAAGRLRSVLDRDFHEEKTTGEDKSIDVVVEIFNVVNSGGTKLSK